jgi:hypothetical protein
MHDSSSFKIQALSTLLILFRTIPCLQLLCHPMNLSLVLNWMDKNPAIVFVTAEQRIDRAAERITRTVTRLRQQPPQFVVHGPAKRGQAGTGCPDLAIHCNNKYPLLFGNTVVICPECTEYLIAVLVEKFPVERFLLLF